jgi:hypothetical protein
VAERSVAVAERATVQEKLTNNVALHTAQQQQWALERTELAAASNAAVAAV